MFRNLLVAAPALLACGLVCRAEDAPSRYTTVTAEGVGLTAEDALKDAFRNAVRQAVGALIDAETLVQNDQVIKDQVLAYSNGMVKAYKEVGKPKREEGLYRVTIVAAVERLSLEEKIAKAKESFQKVDGEGLYAQLLKEVEGEKAQKLTDAERRQTARAMTEKLMEGFPINCLEAELEGDPKVVKREDDKITFQARVRLKANVKAFDDFAARLTTRLEKMARDKGEFALVGELKRNESGAHLEFALNWKEHMGRQFEASQAFPYRVKGSCVLAVNTKRLTAQRTLWKYYELDDTVRHPLASAASCVLTVRLSWLDKRGEVLDTARFPAVFPADVNPPGAANGCLVSTGAWFTRASDKGAGGFRGFDREGYGFMVADEGGEDKGGERLFLLSPFFIAGGWYVPQGVIPHEYTLSLDAVKQIAKIKCELIFEDEKYRELPPKVLPEKK
jgi:hypothetical protein